MRYLLMNSAMMPLPGEYSMSELDLDSFCACVREASARGLLVSYIGYPQNAQLLLQWTGLRVPVNRSETILNPGDTMLIMRLRYRPDAGTKGAPVGENDFQFFACVYLGGKEN